ncbi:hypothetical protein KC363_g39 [Hortaea werneckii]|nr:hypothetical protein KC363_g39 [Hortaea werneckii]
MSTVLATSTTTTPTHLDIASCRHIERSAFFDVFNGGETYPALEYINLSFCNRADTSVVAGIFRSCPALKRLVAFGCFDVQDVVVPRNVALIGVPRAQEAIEQFGFGLGVDEAISRMVESLPAHVLYVGKHQGVSPHSVGRSLQKAEVSPIILAQQPSLLSPSQPNPLFPWTQLIGQSLRDDDCPAFILLEQHLSMVDSPSQQLGMLRVRSIFRNGSKDVCMRIQDRLHRFEELSKLQYPRRGHYREYIGSAAVGKSERFLGRLMKATSPRENTHMISRQRLAHRPRFLLHLPDPTLGDWRSFQTPPTRTETLIAGR